jgi:dihydrodipicolinate synthase/N-acetylneuraminate lyase
MGAAGAVLALACAAPRACCELYDAVKAGDHTRARELQHRLAPLSHIVTAGLGVPGLKAAMNFLGLKGGAPRAPLSALSEADTQRVKAVIRKTGLFPEIE